MEGGAASLKRAAGAVAGLIVALAVPAAIALFIELARTQFEFEFLYLYIPGILFVTYLSGLSAGVAAAAASTLIALSLYVAPVGLTAEKLAGHGLPAALFLLTGVVTALAGDQYRRYQDQLRRDLKRSRRHAQREALVAEVSDALTASIPPEEVAARICRAAAATLGDRCALFLLDHALDAVRLEGFASAEGTHAAERTADTARAVLKGGGELVVRELVQQSGPSVLTRPRPANGDQAAVDGALVLRALDAHAALVAPIRSGGEGLGCLIVLADTPRPWEDDDRAVVQAVADRVAAAVERRRRVRHQARRDRHTRLLSEIMVEFFQEQTLPALLERTAARCTDVLGDWCGLYLVGEGAVRVAAVHHADPARRTRLAALLEQAPLPPDDPFAARIFEERRPAVLDGHDPEAARLLARTPALRELVGPHLDGGLLVVPVYVGEGRLGLLTIGTETRRLWDDEDLRVATAIADRAGAAMRNVQLLESERQVRMAAERDARRLAAINRIIAIAARSLDLGEVFDEFAEALQLLLPFTRVTVSLYDAERDWLTMPYFKGPELSAPAVRMEGPKAGTARGRVLDTSRAFLREDTTQTTEFAEDVILAEAGIRSYVVVPMSVAGHVIGTLNFGHHEPGFYTDRHVALVQPIADHLAITLSHSQLYHDARRQASELSELLQRALLPTDLPRVPFVDMAALYRPADPGARIGGDWYDALLLADDRLMLSIGDVTGRGLPAAVGMGQVRNIARAYALEGRWPGDILTSVNHVLCQMPAAPFLSAWIGMLDPYSGELTYAVAGHPPPCLAHDGTVTPLRTGGPPLGTAPGHRYADARAHMPPASRLLAYTDGLIESTRDVVEGEARLSQAVQATAALPPERAAQAVLDRVLNGSRPADDIAVLVLDCQPVSAPLLLATSAAPENLWRVRRAVRAFAQRQGLGDQAVEAVVIAVGEAVLNVVEHAYDGRPGRVSVQGEVTGDRLVITVRDFGRWRPQLERGRGRGRRIMEGFADAIRVQSTPAGTQVELAWRVGAP